MSELIGDESLRREVERGRLLERLINQAGDCLFVVDSETRRFVDASGALFDQVGYTREELIGRPLSLILPHDRGGELQNTMQRVRTMGSVTLETSHLHKDGREIPVEINIAFADLHGRQFFVGISRNISRRIQARRLLQESEERYRTLVEQAFEGYVVVQNEIIVDANEGLARMLGYKSGQDLIGLGLAEMVAPEFLPMVRERVRMNYRKPYEALARHKDGHPVHVEVCGSTQIFNGNPCRVTVFRDLTERVRADEERKYLEQQLQRAQKMDSLGTLAGGVAHDFNNVLQGLMLAIDRIEKLEISTEGRGFIEDAKAYARRGKQLVQQIMNFTRVDVSGFVETSTSQLLAEVKNLISANLPENVTLTVKNHAQWNVVGSESQLLQGLLNLCNNAVYELRNRPGPGKLVVESFDIPHDHSDVSLLNLPYAPYVKITVNDNGPGIPPRLRQRIFEPFFTTKEPGSGLGLGLSQVHRVVANHYGHIDLPECELGGACFALYLPVSQPLAKIANRVTTNESRTIDKAVLAPQRSATLLLIDDEIEMVGFFQAILEEAGYRVVAFSDAKKALKYLEKHSSDIDLVISDQTMPHVTGLQMADHCSNYRKDLPFILMSGYAHMGGEEGNVNNRVVQVLQKPFTARHLLEVIAQVLQ